jgi:hypothetical protein
VTTRDAARWSVFGADGVWLGDVDMPPRFFMRRVYTDAVFGIWQNEDGTLSVRGYRVEKPGH